MHSLLRWMKNSLLGRVLCCVFVVLFFTPFVAHYYLGKHEKLGTSSALRPRLNDVFKDSKFLGLGGDSIELETMYKQAEDLKKHLKDLEKTKISLNNDLMQMEKNRHALLRQVEEFKTKVEKNKKDIDRLKLDITRGKRILDEVNQARKEAKNCPHLPQLTHLPAPQPIRVHQETSLGVNMAERNKCCIEECLDFSLCSFSSGFTVFVYENVEQDSEIQRVRDYFLSSPYATSDPKGACLFVVVCKDETFTNGSALESLSHWDTDGRNHLIVNIGVSSTLTQLNTGRAMLALSEFHSMQNFRKGFDVVIPPPLLIHEILDARSAWEHAPPQLPAMREYFLSFEGRLRTTSESKPFISVKDLHKLANDYSHIHVKTSCNHAHYQHLESDMWLLCGEHGDRAEILKQSTFTLLLGPGKSSSPQNWTSTHIRLIEAIQYGAVPVILSDKYILPFDDVITWRESAIILPEARFPELLYLLRTIAVSDLLKLRLQGRFLWETYFSNIDRITQTILANVRTRLSLPAKPIGGAKSKLLFSNEDLPMTQRETFLQEIPAPSIPFKRNFTSVNSFSRQSWNHYPGALHLFPYTPFEPFLPSSASFMNSAQGFQPIGGGEGGTGVEFGKALGGNHPKEQFTVVMLTYERELVLIEAIQRLAGLDYLHKVVVVWNSPNPPSLLLKWPDIGVPVHVVKAEKNSLNNRFLPYDVIETEAILSIDDDAQLRHDEIVFGFRVWREARDRIVGFPGRFHAWDVNNGGWLYNSNYSCELSMVLTGAAFFHKFYAFVYSNIMPSAIREKVDEFMNCEDIAMNFLVSHITRKPPIKVTTRWTFRCPGCPVALSQDETHFQERHVCINYFEKVYGYMPLLRTQFRADSVLFKTRIPHDKTKCFKYI